MKKWQKLLMVTSLMLSMTTMANASPVNSDSQNQNVTQVTEEKHIPSYMKPNSIPKEYLMKIETTNNILDMAQQFMGVPYVWGGSSPNGFDCSGFVQYVYRNNGINLSRTADYQALEGEPVDKEDLQPGDLIFFAGDYVNVSHVGIYVGDGKMIHASSSKGQIAYDDLSNSYRVAHYHSARRVIAK